MLRLLCCVFDRGRESLAVSVIRDIHGADSELSDGSSNAVNRLDADLACSGHVADTAWSQHRHRLHRRRRRPVFGHSVPPPSPIIGSRGSRLRRTKRLR